MCTPAAHPGFGSMRGARTDPCSSLTSLHIGQGAPPMTWGWVWGVLGSVHVLDQDVHLTPSRLWFDARAASSSVPRRAVHLGRSRHGAILSSGSTSSVLTSQILEFPPPQLLRATGARPEPAGQQPTVPPAYVALGRSPASRFMPRGPAAAA
jgi:hypothetical protein